MTYTAADDITAAAVALRVVATGHLKAYKTTRLLTAGEFMAAMEQASGTTYQAPTRD